MAAGFDDDPAVAGVNLGPGADLEPRPGEPLADQVQLRSLEAADGDDAGVVAGLGLAAVDAPPGS